MSLCSRRFIVTTAVLAARQRTRPILGAQNSLVDSKFSGSNPIGETVDRIDGSSAIFNKERNSVGKRLNMWRGDDTSRGQETFIPLEEVPDALLSTLKIGSQGRRHGKNSQIE